MSLQKIREILQSAAYMPGSLQLEIQRQALWNDLSSGAKAFVWVAMDKEKPGRATFDEMYGHVWAEDEMTMSLFAGMPRDEQAEVLGFFTFEIHELTHHFDFLTTPFGANFHGKLFREYRAMQRFAPLLLAGPVPAGRFVDYDPFAQAQAPSQDFIAAWREVHDIVATLEALGDGGVPPHARNIALGWGDELKPLVLLNHPLDRVMVRGFLYTVALPDEPGWYLRPSAILEARALVHCLKWICKLFGKDERARGPILTYLESYYASEFAAPDYRFLLDVLALGWGKDFLSFVQAADMRLVQQLLMMMDAACWYALQAPPPMPDASAVRSSPILRLFHALRFFYSAFGNRHSYSHAVEAMTAMDSADEAAAYELIDISQILNFSARFAEYLQQLNDHEILDPVLRSHFDHVLGVQHRRLTERLPKGYVSYSGMPEEGHPVLGLRSDEEVNDLAPDAYEASPRVRDWLSFRNNFMYRHIASSDAARSLRSFF